jgi:hypothetical protein
MTSSPRRGTGRHIRTRVARSLRPAGFAMDCMGSGLDPPHPVLVQAPIGVGGGARLARWRAGGPGADGVRLGRLRSGRAGPTSSTGQRSMNSSRSGGRRGGSDRLAPAGLGRGCSADCGRAGDRPRNPAGGGVPQAPQRHGIHAQEVDGEDPSALGAQEPSPRRARAAPGRRLRRSGFPTPSTVRRRCRVWSVSLYAAVAPQRILLGRPVTTDRPAPLKRPVSCGPGGPGTWTRPRCSPTALRTGMILF